MNDKDTVFSILICANNQHDIRIQGTHDENTINRYRDAIEASQSIEDVVQFLEDEGARVIEYELFPRWHDVEINVQMTRQSAKIFPKALSIETKHKRIYP